MADRRYTLVFYAAILTAAGATFGVYRVLEATKAQSKVETRPIVLAARDLPEGTAIDPTSVVVQQWPAAAIPAGAYASLDSVIGRVTRVGVFTGEAIVPGRLAPPGTGPGLEVKITPGKRAMAVAINDVAGISGLIQPNSRVDVMVTIEDKDNTKEQVAKLFMSNMRVLSVGTQVQRDANGQPIQAPTATLEVTPEEAERLAIAMNQGKIALVLRGFGDPDSVKTDGAIARDVLAQLRDEPVRRPSAAPVRSAARRPAPRPVTPAPIVQQAPAPPKPDSIVVRVWRGDKVTAQKFEVSDSTRTPQR